MTTLLARTSDDATTLPQQSAPPAADVTAPPRATAPSTQPAPPAARRLVLTGVLSRADNSWLEPQLEELIGTGARTVEIDLSGVKAMDGFVARLLLRTSWHLGDPAREHPVLPSSAPARRYPVCRRRPRW